MPSATVKVWDPFVRLFHWSLVAGMAYELIFEPGTSTHNVIGYFLVGLVALRIVWGLVGSPYARFSEFVRSPRAVVSYLKSLVTQRPQHFTGHNPAGGWMVVLLLAAVLATGISGWAMRTDVLWGEEWIEELHEGLANGTMVLIGLHLLGVIVASVQHKENLVRAMITGRKQNHDA